MTLGPDPTESLFELHDSGRWSGGGRSFNANARLAAERSSGIFGDGPITVVAKNVVPARLLLTGQYVFIPQNAWPWCGAAVGVRERVRRAALRVLSEIGFFRARGSVRIGPMIPVRRRAHPEILHNVLDSDFECAMDEAGRVVPDWLPLTDYVLVPGSFWGYRNHGAVLAAHRRLLDQGADLDLVIVGPPGSGAADLVRRAANESGGRVHLVARAVPRVELLAAVMGAKVCVLPSTVEASPLTLLECAAVGKAVVCWDIEGHRAIAEENGLRTVSFVRTSKELADEISRRSEEAVASDLNRPEVREQLRVDWCDSFVRMCTDLVGQYGPERNDRH